jgi:hypothetical protein
MGSIEVVVVVFVVVVVVMVWQNEPFWVGFSLSQHMVRPGGTYTAVEKAKRFRRGGRPGRAVRGGEEAGRDGLKGVVLPCAQPHQQSIM